MEEYLNFVNKAGQNNRKIYRKCRNTAKELMADRKTRLVLRVGTALLLLGTAGAGGIVPASLAAGGIDAVTSARFGSLPVALITGFSSFLLFAFCVVPLLSGLYAFSLMRATGGGDGGIPLFSFYLSDARYHAAVCRSFLAMSRVALFLLAVVIACRGGIFVSLYLAPTPVHGAFTLALSLAVVVLLLLIFLRFSLNLYFFTALIFRFPELNYRRAVALSAELVRGRRRELVLFFLRQLPGCLLICLTGGLAAIWLLPRFLLEHASYTVHFCCEASPG